MNMIFNKRCDGDRWDYGAYHGFDKLNTAQAHRSGIKTQKGGKYENTHESVWARYVPLAQKRRIRGHFMPKRQRIKILLGANSKENLFFFDE
jgi:hypothetical protein